LAICSTAIVERLRTGGRHAAGATLATQLARFAPLDSPQRASVFTTGSQRIGKLTEFAM
jgi:hypothetical protein